MRFRRPSYIVAAVILLLLAVRVALPYIVEDYVNKTLDELPGYTGHVDDIYLHLYRGAYTINNLVLVEENGDPKYPFLQIPQTDLSIEWKSLLKGKLVGEVVMERPRMNLVATETAADTTQQTTQDDWTKVMKDLMPITINRFVVNNGRVAYLDFNASPDVNMHIENLQLVALNLANIEDSTTALPSTVTASGRSVGDGLLQVDMRGNFLKRIPDLDMSLKLTGVNLTSLNDFIKANAKFDVERGRLDMYSKVKLTNGQLGGFVKPFLEEVKILNWEKDKKEDGFLHAAKEAIIGLFAEAAENQKRDQLATQVPISGSISAPDTDTWRTFVNTLRHAFIDAFNKSLENEVRKARNKEEEKD